MRGVRFSDTELSCLALLGEIGDVRLSEFTATAVARGILGSTAAVNTCLSKVEKSEFFIKKGAGKKMIFLNPILGIKSESDVLLVFNVVQDDPKRTKVSVPKNSAEAQLA